MAAGLTLEGRITEVRRLATLAKRHYEVWRVYTDPESRKRLWHAFDAYAAFMLLDEHAHHDLAILYVSSLFETGKRTVHLRDLVDQLRKTEIATELASEIETLLRALEISAKKAHFIRNNSIGHRTASMSRQDVFMRAAITANELGELVRHADAVASKLADAVGYTPVILEIDPSEALEQLFTDASRMRTAGHEREVGTSRDQ